MSGYCSKCGNTMCLCKEMEDEEIVYHDDMLDSIPETYYSKWKKLKEENKKLKEEVEWYKWVIKENDIIITNT